MALRGRVNLERVLRDLPRRMEKNILRAAVSQAGTVVRKAEVRVVKRIVDKTWEGVGQSRTTVYKSGAPRQRLHKSIRRIVRTRKSSVYSVIGPGYREAPHDIWVNDGTKAHYIHGAAWLAPVFVSRDKYPWLTPISHPGSRKKPFAEIAFMLSRAAAMRKMRSSIASRIGKLKSP